MSTFPLLPERPDVLPMGVAPKHLRKWLRDVGGVTPNGENRYRLVLVQFVMLYCGARWHDYVEGASSDDAEGLDFSPETRKSVVEVPDPARPGEMTTMEMEVPAAVAVRSGKVERIVEEMRWIERYPEEKGWMLQAWFPPTYYDKEHYEVTVTGRADLPLLGEFPSHGQYERQFAYFDPKDGSPRQTFESIPGQTWMEMAIQHNEREIIKRGPILEDATERKWRSFNALNEMQKARAHYELSKQNHINDKIKDSISPIFSHTLAGGRFREMLAQRCREQGIQIGHVGN